jgi:hypothetical protein
MIVGQVIPFTIPLLPAFFIDGITSFPPEVVPLSQKKKGRKCSALYDTRLEKFERKTSR